MGGYKLYTLMPSSAFTALSALFMDVLRVVSPEMVDFSFYRLKGCQRVSYFAPPFLGAVRVSAFCGVLWLSAGAARFQGFEPLSL